MRRRDLLAMVLAVATVAQKHLVPSGPNPSDESGHGQRCIHLRADARNAPVTTPPHLDQSSDYAGPADPSTASRLAICNPQVRRAIDLAWGSSMLASHRPPISVNDKTEYGFAIQADSATHLLSVGSMETSDLTGNRPNELTIPVNADTIATVHTHNIGARPTPSAADVGGDLPAFVRSQFHLYVTIPHTDTFAEVDVHKACGLGR